MPARSKAQQRLMAAAEHGATFPKAKQIRASMTHSQMRDFALGSMKGKPAHVKVPRVSTKPKMPRAKHPDGESYAYNWRTRNNLKRGR